jgi:nucleotide-binding universal stress UspA family protein
MSIQHILVPTDFSPYAEYAVDYATQLAKTLQARLTLLHVVYEILWAAGEGAMALPPNYFEELEASAQASLDKVLQRVQAAGVQGDAVVVHGIPFENILHTARTQGVDLIIMGTHGRTGLKHVLIGSVAERVVRLAPCPVLVTRGTIPAQS